MTMFTSTRPHQMASEVEMKTTAMERFNFVGRFARKGLYWAEANIEIIDPNRARELLKNDTTIRNRKLSSRNIERIKSDITEGRWDFTGETLIRCVSLTGQGMLVDGQNRLNSIIDLDVTLVFVVVTICCEAEHAVSLFDKIDQGKIRSVADALTSLLGTETETKTIAAAITALCVADILIPLGNVSYGRLSGPARTEFGLRSIDEVMWATTIKRSRMAGKVTVPTGSVAALIVCHRLSEEHATYFADHLVSGSDLGLGSPILALRDHILDQRRRGVRGNGTGVAEMRAIYDLTINAWNRWIRGESGRFLGRGIVVGGPQITPRSPKNSLEEMTR